MMSQIAGHAVFKCCLGVLRHKLLTMSRVDPVPQSWIVIALRSTVNQSARGEIPSKHLARVLCVVAQVCLDDHGSATFGNLCHNLHKQLQLTATPGDARSFLWFLCFLRATLLPNRHKAFNSCSAIAAVVARDVFSFTLTSCPWSSWNLRTAAQRVGMLGTCKIWTTDTFQPRLHRLGHLHPSATSHPDRRDVGRSSIWFQESRRNLWRAHGKRAQTSVVWKKNENRHGEKLRQTGPRSAMSAKRSPTNSLANMRCWSAWMPTMCQTATDWDDDSRMSTCTGSTSFQTGSGLCAQGIPKKGSWATN